MSAKKSIGGKLRYEAEKIRQKAHYQDELRKMEQRRSGAGEPQFDALREMRGCYEGKRCFVIADGSALREEDLTFLRDEITFGTGDFLEQEYFQPTYVGIQNPSQYRAMRARLEQSESTVLAGDNLAGAFDLPQSMVQYPYLGVYKYYCNAYGEYGAKFSGNAYEVVYDGYHVVYSMMQLAVYFGCSEIVLIGCDWNERFAAACVSASRYASEHGITIVNASESKQTELFPYKSLKQMRDKP